MVTPAWAQGHMGRPVPILKARLGLMMLSVIKSKMGFNNI